MQDARPLKAHDDLLDEGDILANAPVLSWKDGEPKFTAGRVIVTSHGCACDDYHRALAEGRTSAARRVMIMVAPLRNANSFPSEAIEAIKRGEFYDRFYVYGDGARLHDQIADLTRESNVPATILVGSKKVARIENWQWKRLLVALTVARWHQPPETIFPTDSDTEGSGAP